MEKDGKTALLEQLNASMADGYTSWADLYDRMKGVAAGYTSYPTPETAAMAIAHLLAFVLALEELPEEGDVVTIARKVNEIMAMRPEATGITLVSGDDALRMIEEMRSRVMQRLSDESEVFDTPAASHGKLLH